MPAVFWTHYATALVTAASLLVVLYAIARGLARRRSRHAGPRVIGVVETLALSPQAALHAIRAGERYFLIGSTPNGLVALGELEVGKLPDLTGTE